MPSQDLGSELARASLGIVPASSVPEIVLSQFSLISWDHQKAPGFFWRLPSLTWQDLNEGKVTSIDGFKVEKYETLVVLREGKIVALVPEGSWVMKPDSGLEGKETNGSWLEIVWVDLRPKTFGFDVDELHVQGTRFRLQGELTIRIADPAKLVEHLLLMQSKDFMFMDDVLERLSILIRGEASSLEHRDPSWQSSLLESVRKKLSDEILEWGLVLTDLKTAGETSAIGSFRGEEASSGEEGRVVKESDVRTATISPQVAIEASPVKSATIASDSVIQMLDWDTAPKRWIPASRKGELKCDGCGGSSETFAVCALSCRFLQKCRLCRRCYPLRRSCAFFVSLETLQPKKRMVDERKELAKTDAGRRLGARY